MNVADATVGIGVTHEVHLVHFLRSVVKPDYNSNVTGPPEGIIVKVLKTLAKIIVTDFFGWAKRSKLPLICRTTFRSRGVLC